MLDGTAHTSVVGDSSTSKSPYQQTMRTNVTSFPKLWYILLIIILYIWMIWHTILDYRTYKSQAYDPRYGNQWQEIPMSIGVCVLLFVCSLFPLHLYSAILPVGHIVNDAQTLTQNEGAALKSHIHQMFEYSSGRLIAARLSFHVVRPCAYTIHLLTGMALLIPAPLFLAERIKNEAASKFYLWQSEWIYWVTGRASFPGIDTQSDEWGCEISIFTLNYCFAAILFFIHYPASFWQTAPCFTNIYSTFGFISLTQLLLEFYSFSLFHKLTINGVLPIYYVYSSWTCLILFLASALITWLSLIVIFEYGYLHALLSLSRHRQYFLSDKSSKVFVEETIVKTSSQFLSKYWTISLGIGLFLLQVSFKLVIMMEYGTAATKTGSVVFLSYVIFTSVFLFLSMLVWFTFCVKKNWYRELSNVITNTELQPRQGSIHSLLNNSGMGGVEIDDDGVASSIPIAGVPPLPQTTTEETLYHFYSGNPGTLRDFNGMETSNHSRLPGSTGIVLTPSLPDSDEEQQNRYPSVKKSTLSMLQVNSNPTELLPGLSSFPGSPRPPVPGSTGGDVLYSTIKSIPNIQTNMKSMKTVVTTVSSAGPPPPNMPPKVRRNSAHRAPLHFKSPSVSGSGMELDKANYQESPNLSTSSHRGPNFSNEVGVFDESGVVRPQVPSSTTNNYQVYPFSRQQTYSSQISNQRSNNSEYIDLSSCHFVGNMVPSTNAVRVPFSSANSVPGGVGSSPSEFGLVQVPDILQVTNASMSPLHGYTNWAGSPQIQHHLYNPSFENDMQNRAIATFLDRQGLTTMGIAEEDFQSISPLVDDTGLEDPEANTNLCSEV